MSLRHNQKSLTLLELLVAITLLSVIILGYTSISQFSRYHVLSSERSSVVQNEVSLVLEHMTKQVGRAIGNEMVNGANSVVMANINPNSSLLRVYIDANGNGQREAPVNNPQATADHWIAYRYDSLGAPTNRNELRYCSRCRERNAACNFNQCMDTVETLGTHITLFTPNKPVILPGVDNRLSSNFVSVRVTACHDPDGAPNACNTPDNPAVTMDTSIIMPSVSTN